MKNFTLFAVVVIAVAGMPSQLRAGVQINDLITVGNGVGHPGGIYNIKSFPSNAPLFDTFCVELGEFIAFGPTYRVDNVGTVSVSGNKTLQPFTAWLYHKFLGGTLPSFNPTNGQDANTLQFAIWKDMGYTANDMNTQVLPGWYAFYDPLLTAKNWQTAYNSDVLWSGIGNIRIVNLKTLPTINAPTGNNAQDVLTELPEPLSIMVWSLIAMIVGSMGSHNRRPPLRLAV